MMCPTCNSELVLRQINLNTAVYMCKRRSCSYPVDHEWIFVTKNLENILNENNKMKSEQQNVDDQNKDDSLEWLDNLCREGIDDLQFRDVKQSSELSAVYDEILKELNLTEETKESNSIIKTSEFSVLPNSDMPMLELDFH